jgi:hypothetical protein
MLVGSKGVTFVETCYCCTSLFCTVGFFASILSKVASMLEEKATKTKDYKKNKEILNIFYKRENVSYRL